MSVPRPKTFLSTFWWYPSLQVEHFKQGIIRKKDCPGFCYFSQLTIEVCGITDLVHKAPLYLCLGKHRMVDFPRIRSVRQQKFRNPYHQTLVDAYRNFILKAILASTIFFFKIINIDYACCRIYDPVLSYPCSAIFEKFYAIIHLLGCWQDNLNYQIRGTITSFVRPEGRRYHLLCKDYSVAAPYSQLLLKRLLVPESLVYRKANPSK